MPTPTLRGRRKPRVRRPFQRALPADAAPAQRAELKANWRDIFFESLAENSNVAQACAKCGVTTASVYDLRRRDLTFADAWMVALAAGYDNLEVELLDRLRNGDGGAARFNYAVALRVLAAHRDSVSHEKGRRESVDAAEVRASILGRLAQLREQVLAADAEADAEAEAGPEPKGEDRDDAR